MFSTEHAIVLLSARGWQTDLGKFLVKKVKVSIIGSGIVGQATGIGLALNGNEVLFHDIDKKKLQDLEEKGYQTTDSLIEAVTASELVFVAVPTPTVDNKIVLDIVQDCTKNIGKTLWKTWKYVDIVYRSTIPPGTTRTKLVPALESYSGLKAGKDFGVCMNPEFLREKSPLEDFLHPSRMVIGEYDERSGNALTGVYSQFRGPIIRTTLDSAEMIVYLKPVPGIKDILLQRNLHCMQETRHRL